MDDVYELLREAIQNKRNVYLVYDGRPRYLCPHVLGQNEDRETGGLRYQFLAYQYDGDSSRGIFPVSDPRAVQNWRCMFLGKVTDARLIDGPWYSLSRHTMPQKCVRHDLVDFEVEGWS